MNDFAECTLTNNNYYTMYESYVFYRVLKIGKATISLAVYNVCPTVRRSVRPSVLKENLGSHWKVFELLDISIFSRLWWKFSAISGRTYSCETDEVHTVQGGWVSYSAVCRGKGNVTCTKL